MQNTEFGYSRKDIILLGVGLIGLGYAAYYGLQVGNMLPLTLPASLKLVCPHGFALVVSLHDHAHSVPALALLSTDFRLAVQITRQLEGTR